MTYFLLSLFLTMQLSNWNMSTVQNQIILVFHRIFQTYLALDFVCLVLVWFVFSLRKVFVAIL